MIVWFHPGHHNFLLFKILKIYLQTDLDLDLWDFEIWYDFPNYYSSQNHLRFLFDQSKYHTLLHNILDQDYSYTGRNYSIRKIYTNICLKIRLNLRFLNTRRKYSWWILFIVNSWTKSMYNIDTFVFNKSIDRLNRLYSTYPNSSYLLNE